ncbi:MAG: error-prone DNA polymerase [Rhodospirillales bacterium]
MAWASGRPAYAELQVTTNYSFLRGASHSREMIEQAIALGLDAIAIADRNTLGGVVRAYGAAFDLAKKHGTLPIRLVIGCRLVTQEGFSLLAYPMNLAGYGQLTKLLTLGNLRTGKGQCELYLEDLWQHAADILAIVVPPDRPDDIFEQHLAQAAAAFAGRCYLAGNYLYRGDDLRRLSALDALARRSFTPMVATNDVHYHHPERRILQDVLTCIREKCTIEQAGWRLNANAERHLKPAEEMARLFAHWPDAIARTTEIASRCTFSMTELDYQYPAEEGTNGLSAQEELERLVWLGAGERFPHGVAAKQVGQILHELDLIRERKYAAYFLTVHEIVQYARHQNILCQGRGSAANSTVCYCLHITEVNPDRNELLFERFISSDRNEPPDIDVDFEHERREEVIQHIYQKYGRGHAALTATVISYRSRSAIRDVGKVLGLSPDTVGALADTVWGTSDGEIDPKHVRDAGLDPRDKRLGMALKLAGELTGFPRHLSQHVGGFVICRHPLDRLVPVSNAAMENRTVIEWDKDDLDVLKILKIDVLALGMLTCIRKAFELVERHHGNKLTLDIAQDDPQVYGMLSRADSLGVFQVESRAQMSMLPRLKPNKFYDLVIEVAIVRPGPIQGDMVHPYLRRRDGIEPVRYPSKALEQVLGRTLGVPLFQEQAMKIAIVAAGFTPAEADRLRRAMATFRHNGQIHSFESKMIEGMIKNGYTRDFAERCFNQIKGFGEYGFPESHAASFALLVYVSSWLKWYYPDVFAAALLNSQPMGFYAPAQIVRDAREHGVEMLPPDVNLSDWDNALETAVAPSLDKWGKATFPLVPGPGGRITPLCAMRMGFRQIDGCSEKDMKHLVAKRGAGYGTMQELWQRSSLSRRTLEKLAKADAFQSMGLGRRESLWAVRGLRDDRLPLFNDSPDKMEIQREAEIALPAMALGEHVVDDYNALRMSLRCHPLKLLRPALARLEVTTNNRLDQVKDGRRIVVAGLSLVRQRPGSANGVVFITTEDEFGIANIVVWPDVFERYRREVMTARLLLAEGKLQKQGLVIHLVAARLTDLSPLLDTIGREDFEQARDLIVPELGNSDGVKNGGPIDDNRLRRRGGHPRNVRIPIKSHDFH